VPRSWPSRAAWASSSTQHALDAACWSRPSSLRYLMLLGTAAAALLAAAAALSRSAFPAYPLWVLNLRGHPCLRARPPAVAPVSCLWSAAIVLPAHSHSYGMGFLVHAR
jgi:hypothetical protein